MTEFAEWKADTATQNLSPEIRAQTQFEYEVKCMKLKQRMLGNIRFIGMYEYMYMNIFLYTLRTILQYIYVYSCVNVKTLYTYIYVTNIYAKRNLHFSYAIICILTVHIYNTYI